MSSRRRDTQIPTTHRPRRRRSRFAFVDALSLRRLRLFYQRHAEAQKPPFELEVRVCNARVRRPVPFLLLLLVLVLALVFGVVVGHGALTAWWSWCSRRHEHVAPSSSQSLSRRPFPVDEIDHSVPLVHYRAQFGNIIPFSLRHRRLR